MVGRLCMGRKISTRMNADERGLGISMTTCEWKKKEHGFSRIARMSRIFLTGFGFASEDEVSRLEGELVSSGYGWLVDYSVGDICDGDSFAGDICDGDSFAGIRIEVYEKDSDVKIAEFENVNVMGGVINK